MAAPGPIGYAHRGYAPDGAENTLAAFQAAVELGFTHLETDARVTRDGVAVAFHDPMLDRITNSTGLLRQLDWHRVRQARVLGRHPIPVLADVLGGFPDAAFNVDVKSDAAIGPTLDALRHTNSWHRVRLAAFSHRRLMALRRAAGPAVASSLSPVEVAALKLGRLRPPDLGTERLPGAAQVPLGVAAVPLISARFVENAHRLGLQVHAWTINTRAEMGRLFDVGVDAIMSDRAELLREVLRERGAWPG
ncbi:MAG TPA: glycerophosphodiester phosphodiesterase family protein [Jatrophihabitans sp.]|nr:glycerophosphodiester phosphodiesterase family protein [Jatrophihabitans sp.]